MNLLETALRRIVADLNSLGARWAIVGGFAVSARVEPRTTRDVDVVVAVASDPEAESLVHALQALGYRVLAVVEHESAKRLATARLALPQPHDVLVDLLFASSGIEPEITDGAEVYELLPGLEASVATIGHLLALKILARDDRARPQDWDDIQALLREAAPNDLAEARAAVALIERRGFHRGKALGEQLEELVVARKR